MSMSDVEKRVRKRMRDDFAFYAYSTLKIRTKESASGKGGLERFELNSAQKHIHAKITEQKQKTGKVRAIILKGRQQGCSTYVEGRYIWLVTHNFGVQAFILTHHESATANLFGMVKRYYDNLIDEFKPAIKASNAIELSFSTLDSGYKLGTAGNKSVGRSSTIQYLHASEAAFYQHTSEHTKGIFQAVPDAEGTEIIIESTANGVGNFFHKQWQLAEAGETDYIAIFVPWFWQNEYRKAVKKDFERTEHEQFLAKSFHLDDEQLQWRRDKIAEFRVTDGRDAEKAFMQEYPNTPEEAFQESGEDGYIDRDLVTKARRNNYDAQIEGVGDLIIGVDIARKGKDRSAIIRRKGRRAYNLDTFRDKTTMEMVSIIHQVIKNEKPTRVFVDEGGVGAGVLDRLHELGYTETVVGVNSGSSSSLNVNKFMNKRSEMWCSLKRWLEDEPCVIPDSDELHADICNTRSKEHSSGKLLMESKKEMRGRDVRSSDTADALCLTFAYPVRVEKQENTQDKQRIANILTERQTLLSRLF